MNTTTTLRQEHDVILQAIDILLLATDGLARGEVEHRAVVADLVGFFREFMDDCHHAKEEKVLFPALVEAGLPGRAGPIAVMLREHDLGRGHLSAIRGLLPQVGDLASVQALHRSAKDFAELLKGHIAKENQVLFEIAGQLIPSSEHPKLMAAFEEHEKNTIGPQKRRGYIELIEGLAQKYGVVSEMSNLPAIAHCC